MLDIRKAAKEDSTIQFGDNEGGTGRITMIRSNVPVQFDIVDRSGKSVGHVKRKDLPYLIKALQYAEANWEAPE